MKKGKTALRLASAAALALSTVLLCPSCDDAASNGGPAARAPARAPGASAPRTITPEEARRRLGSGEPIVILDVRPELTRGAEGHILGDVNIPLTPPERFAAEVQRVVTDKNAAVFVYCKAGIMSAHAADVMAGLGYRNVFVLGTFASWPYERER